MGLDILCGTKLLWLVVGAGILGTVTAQDTSCTCDGGCGNNGLTSANGREVNVAYGKSASMSGNGFSDIQGTAGPACVAVNGRTSVVYRTLSESDTNCIHSSLYDYQPWWQVNLGQNYTVRNLTIYRRVGQARRMADIDVHVDNTVCYSFPSSSENNALDALPEKIDISCNQPLTGQMVKLEKRTRDTDYHYYFLNICEVQVWGPPCTCDGGCGNDGIISANGRKMNVAYGKSASMSSTGYRGSKGTAGPACAAVNGRASAEYRTLSESGTNCIHSSLHDYQPWWQVNLGQNYTVTNLTIYRREDNAQRMADIDVLVDNTVCHSFPSSLKTKGRDALPEKIDISCNQPLTGQVVKFEKRTRNTDGYFYILNLCEVQVWVCAHGYYGNSCQNNCGRCKNGVTCNIETGVCPDGCQPGWTNKDCQTECEDGTYGDGCSSACGNCSVVCNKEDGTCPSACQPGFDPSDPLCKTHVRDVCNKNCSETCGGSGNCDSVDDAWKAALKSSLQALMECVTKCTPQEFFQTFATFLHDCKYYWKLAHRNLARDKFERDFSTKCQLSCSSLPGFTKLKDKMIRTVATLQNDQEMRASKAQQLQHINNWIESLDKYDQELDPEAPSVTRDAAYGNAAQDPRTGSTPGQHDRKHHRQREHGSHQTGSARSISPKPIGSTPPNVHKPQPINHVSPTTVSSTYSSNSFPNKPNGTGPVNTAHNYHQHFQSDAETLEEPYEPLNRATMAIMNQEGESGRDMVDGSGKRNSQDSGQRKNQNFSLRSWLRRDQRQRNSNNELSPSKPQPPQYPPQQPSAKSPSTPFNKLHNSVVQKFSGSGSSKKSSETSKPLTTQPCLPNLPEPKWTVTWHQLTRFSSLHISSSSRRQNLRLCHKTSLTAMSELLLSAAGVF